MSTASSSNLIKVYDSADDALSGLAQEASLFVSGYAAHHEPEVLLRSVADSGVGDLTVICLGGERTGQPPQASTVSWRQAWSER